MEYLEKDGIVCDLYGGLGNQMFIVAASHVISRTHGCPFVLPTLPTEKNPHNLLGHNYNDTIFSQFGEHIDIPVEHVRTFCMMNGYRYYTNGAFQRWDPMSILPRTFVNSHFQYYPPLAAYEQELRELFVHGIQSYRTRIAETVGDLTECAFLHIRRGDYLNHPTIHYNQPLSYYETAVNRLMAEASELPKQILVLSDDSEWVRAQPFFTNNPIYTIVSLDDELETLAYMSLCKAGAICANSTFSWWGAFLGAFGSRNPVIVPSRWICDPIEKLFPDEWIVL